MPTGEMGTRRSELGHDMAAAGAVRTRLHIHQLVTLMVRQEEGPSTERLICSRWRRLTDPPGC